MNERDKALFEINALKSLLNNSDYQIIKLMESLASCTTAVSLLAALKEFTVTFGELVTKRQQWRAKINELEEQLVELEARANEEMAQAMAAEAAETPTEDEPTDDTEHADDAGAEHADDAGAEHADDAGAEHADAEPQEEAEGHEGDDEATQDAGDADGDKDLADPS